jgi:hypothetical protein
VLELAGDSSRFGSISGVSLGVSKDLVACDSSEVSTFIVLPCFFIVLLYDFKGGRFSYSSKSSTSNDISCNISRTSGVACDWLSLGLYCFVTLNTTFLVFIIVF